MHCQTPAPSSLPPPPKKRGSRKIIIGVVVVVLLGLFFLNPISLCLMGWLIGEAYYINRAEAKIRKPEVYMPVGEALALYCQSYELLNSVFNHEKDGRCDEYGGTGYGIFWWETGLPKEAYSKAAFPSYTMINQDEASVEFGGGFHHFGYRLSLDAKASSAFTNVWQLVMYSEDSNDRNLATFHMDAERRCTIDEVLANMVASCDALINRNHHDLHGLERAWKKKINTYLRLGKIAEARATCREMLDAKLCNWSWWPRLTVALITAEEESFEQAERMMTQWVEKDKHFSGYLDLAFFYKYTDKPAEAAEALRQAMGLEDKCDCHLHYVDYSGYPAALYAYASGEYDTVVQFCDDVLPIATAHNEYRAANLQALRAAAVEARENPGEATPIEGKKGTFDPYEDVDIERLLQRPVLR